MGNTPLMSSVNMLISGVRNAVVWIFYETVTGSRKSNA